MFEISLIDDVKVDRKVLSRHLQDYFDGRGIDAEISEYTSSEEFLSSGNTRVDIVFLDIYMDEMNGVELARKIRSKSRDVSIVFVSGSNEFASEAFEVGADSYLKKPVVPDSLYNVMDNILAKKKADISIEIIVDRRATRIYMSEITYAETSGRHLIIHTANGEYESTITLKDFMGMVPEGAMVRISRFELVSLDAVDSLNMDVLVTKAGDRLTVSKKYLDEVKEAMHSRSRR
ncbi:MAG: LytTR family DNA-binding domain-containing protein [Eubacterium sp.]|nr:LytTR family DNA-binding domain-containing protein [Eubacterium sp.]